MSRDSELTMVLISRGDLKLSRGKLAAQCSHATAECILKAKKSKPRELDRYLRQGARKIICKTENLQSLKELFSKAKKMNLISYMVTDAGHTEIPPGTITIVGIGPGPRETIDKITGTLSLLS